MAKHKYDLNKRVQQLRRDTDVVKDISVSIEDIVVAVKHHIVNNIKPIITENDIVREVPVHYANPERWADIQKNGWMRDPKSNQPMVPVIVFKYTSISKNTSIPVDKLDGNLRILISKKWNANNRYDSFNIKNGIIPTTEYYSTLIPDYVKITFDVSIWTAYITHLNKILEKFIYAEGTYWGDKDRMLFKTAINNYDTIVDIESGGNRSVKTNFTLEVDGYILPKEYNNEPTTIKKLNPDQIVIGFETEKQLLDNELLLRNVNPTFLAKTLNDTLDELTNNINNESVVSSTDNKFIWYK